MSVQDQIRAEAIRQGIDPSVALAVAQRESNFRQTARGSSGEVGIFQLMPGTAADLGVDPYDQAQNIAGGVRYLRQMIGRYGLEQGLQAYNGGASHVIKGDVSGPAREYARAIMAAIGGSTEPTSFPTLPELEPLTIAALVIGTAAAALIIVG